MSLLSGWKKFQLCPASQKPKPTANGQKPKAYLRSCPAPLGERSALVLWSEPFGVAAGRNCLLGSPLGHIKYALD